MKLGLLPGAGGTQRVPRLIGAAAALEMIAGGEPISAQRALELGLIDAIVEDDLEGAAIARARELAEAGISLRRTRDLSEQLSNPEERAEIRGGRRRRAEAIPWIASPGRLRGGRPRSA